MNQRKEEDTTEADFIIRSYTKAELAQLYCPGLDPVLALQKLYRWMRKNTALTQALSDVNYNKYNSSKNNCFTGNPWKQQIKGISLPRSKRL